MTVASLMALLMAVLGLALMVGALGHGRALGLLCRLLLLAIMGPLMIALLPLWLLLFLGIGAGLAGFRGLCGMVLGRRAADHMVGILAADVARFFFRLMAAPFRRGM